MTLTRGLQNPKCSDKGVTTQMKAIDEYILILALFVLSTGESSVVFCLIAVKRLVDFAYRTAVM